MKQTKTLPSEIPIFPLSNFIFFPKTSIPLNIFEPRYLQMIRDSLKKDRFIGMVQPKKNIKKLSKNNPPEIYSIGCVGKITDFNETGDGRIILILNGISRFKILEELDNNKLYRECKVSFDQFKEDIKEMEKTSKFLDIDLLFKDLKNFFRKKNFFINWNELKKQNLDQVINTLSMIAPFSLEEKQILLESKNIKERKKKFREILNIYLTDSFENKTLQ